MPRSDQDVSQGHGSARPAQAAENALADLDVWLRERALPLWWRAGADHAGGGFFEALNPSAEPVGAFRRVRVQSRQAYVYALAGRFGWQGPWREAAVQGLSVIDSFYRRTDGLYRRLVDGSGKCLDDSAQLYDQAFVLLAFSEAARAGLDPPTRIAQARALGTAINAMRWPAGGFRESGDQPFQANCHMHLLEACMAWMTVEGVESDAWRALAGEIVDLALSRFISGDFGLLHEFFDEHWAVASRASGGCFDPGHQFEWSWLLTQWNHQGGSVDRALIDRLYHNGRRGVSARSGCVINRMSDDFEVLDGAARLWPQTEYVRAAEMMWRRHGSKPHAEHVIEATRAVAPYLDTPIPGLWWDLRDASGECVRAESPASSLYHLVCMLKPSAS